MLLLKVRPPLHPNDLHARLRAALYYYAHHKPHQGIKGAAPANCMTARPGLHQCYSPARVYEKKSDDKLFDIAYLNPDRLLPVLIPKAA